MCLKHKKNISLVNICPENLLLIELILENQGYTVTVIDNQDDRLDKIEQICPDLIILELATSHLSHPEIINHFKNQDYLAQIPLLLLTGNKNFLLEEFVEADAVCYKPFEIDCLLTQVKSLLKCEATVKNSTLILDIDDQDPLVKEYQNLQLLLDREQLIWKILQQQGYEIYNS